MTCEQQQKLWRTLLPVEDKIARIEEAIHGGVGYTALDRDGSIIIFFEHAKLMSRIPARVYEKTRRLARDPADFLVWCPSAAWERGHESPWGRGNTTIQSCQTEIEQPI
jgi:cysteinyl-tRNA synthetase